MTTPVNPYDFLNSTSGTNSTTGSNQQLGQNQFLTLMLAQLKNQDPMNPQDPSQFMSQLAQFSQVTGIQNMQTSMDNLASSMRSSQLLSGTNLVGREILAKGTADTTTTAGQDVFGAADVPDGTNGMLITVKDASGATVRTFSAPATKGLNHFTWDGLDGAGIAAPAGTYSFDVQANVAGTAQAVDPLLVSKVGSVTIDPSTGSLTLNTDAGTVNFSDVRSVL